MPLDNHRLSWAMRAQLRETLTRRAATLRGGPGESRAERDARELAEVTAALERVETPQYGSCAGCGAPIAWERLFASPQVRRCVRCEAAEAAG